MTTSKKHVAIILSGCGVKDGSEIHEAVCSMLAVARAGMTYQCFAPDIAQHHVTNHLIGQPMKESRNCLVEAARIARGQIKPLAQFEAKDFDAMILPGGYGAVTNLSSFADKGANCQVNSDVTQAVQAMCKAKKPIGALCIAPAILAKLIPGVVVTAGEDEEVHAAMRQMGAQTKNTTHGEVVVDEENKVVTSPCYMLEATIDQIYAGAENVVKALRQLM